MPWLLLSCRVLDVSPIEHLFYAGFSDGMGTSTTNHTQIIILTDSISLRKNETN